MLLTWSKYSQDNILNTSVQKHVTFIISHLIFLTILKNITSQSIFDGNSTHMLNVTDEFNKINMNMSKYIIMEFQQLNCLYFIIMW